MGIGHYGVSFALKAADKNISLGLLFLAAQFVDILWLIFVLLGIERVNIVPGVTAANPFDFVFYPFTHSLVASFLWAGAVYVIFRFIPVQPASRQSRVALVMGAAVLSHFFLDLIVHRPDLPLASGDSYKIGFGLWNYVLAAYVLEGLLLLVGLWIYLQSTKGATLLGKYGMSIFAVCLLVANLSVYHEDVLNFFMPLPLTPEIFASSALGYHFLFVGIAFWLDQKRS